MRYDQGSERLVSLSFGFWFVLTLLGWFALPPDYAPAHPLVDGDIAQATGNGITDQLAGGDVVRAINSLCIAMNSTLVAESLRSSLLAFGGLGRAQYKDKVLRATRHSS